MTRACTIGLALVLALSGLGEAQEASPAPPSAETPAAVAPPPPRPLPPVRELVARAVAAARARGPRATRELARRARLSGLMPELRVGLERGSQLDLSSSDTGQSSRTSTAQGDALKLQAALSFDLPRLVFASEEVRILSVERWLASDLQELSAQIVGLYFRHRRAARALAEGDLERRDEVDELEAMLDLLSDGGVSRLRPSAAPAFPSGPGAPKPEGSARE